MQILPSYPSIEDCVSEKPLDFEKLRNEVVTGFTYAPSFGGHKNLQQHINMLAQEFSGQLRLKLLHAILIVLLRRNIDAKMSIASSGDSGQSTAIFSSKRWTAVGWFPPAIRSAIIRTIPAKPPTPLCAAFS
jgi:hypothetical protein